jgi:cell division protein FtsB
MDTPCACSNWQAARERKRAEAAEARVAKLEARVAELEAENEDLKYEIVGMHEAFAAVHNIETSVATICKNKGWEHLAGCFEQRAAFAEKEE